jgi:hypothetical protein
VPSVPPQFLGFFPEGLRDESLLAFADRVRDDVRDLKPRDMIDIPSFIWVQGSDEYEE